MSSICHASSFEKKSLGNTAHKVIKIRCIVVVSGKGFLILSPLINVAAVAMEAEHEDNGQEQ